ncbi:hypothetical protein ABW19_dt0208558 [Dactylella cylindrospora]|nr:hypothetical protein ABW19_dt0208558 [Dactylella cylindrospora]
MTSTSSKPKPKSKSKKKRKPTSSLLSRSAHAKPSSASSKPLPSKLSRKLIRSHHTAQKRLSQAIVQNDSAAIASLQSELSSTGGLEAYQRASVSGQSSQRGGDSSRILVDWFTELGVPKPTSSDKELEGYRFLEIGCLSPANAIHAYFPKNQRTLMDLNSLHPEILKQDFMTFPLPEKAEDGYDVLSCSLVLNYVPTPAGRGEMLRRISSFMEQGLQRQQRRLEHQDGKSEKLESIFPALFFVLPAPCVTNSRYLTEERLGSIMASMGFEMLKRKLSPKLVYYLWKYVGCGKKQKFKKLELLPGGKRNNFAMVVE